MLKKLFFFLLLLLALMGWTGSVATVLAQENAMTVAPEVNNPPVLDSIGPQSLNEGQTLQFRVHGSDPDLHAVILSAENAPANASFYDSLNGAGLFTFSPDYNQAGTHNVLFIITDVLGLADSELVSIEVLNTTAWVTVHDTAGFYTGQKKAKVTVTMETEQPIGGINLIFILSKANLMNFRNHIEVKIDTIIHDTTVVRACDLDTIRSCTNNFEWLYAYGSVGDTSSPACTYVRVAGKAKDGHPIPGGSCVLFKLVLTIDCLPDTQTERSLYMFVEGELSDPSGYIRYVTNFYPGYISADSIHRCGDVNADRNISLADVIYIANYVLGIGASPCPVKAGDVSLDNKITFTDAIMLANYIFLGTKAGCFAQ